MQLIARRCRGMYRRALSGRFSVQIVPSMAAGFHIYSPRLKPICNPTKEDGSEKLAFPIDKQLGFDTIRNTPGMIYWDKTLFIEKLEELSPTLLLCRPRGFGKSLIISMLNLFHGVEFSARYDELFKVWFTL